ncbi:MAG: GNAT family N-acetyltransferase [Thermoanaerobaculales bacterium]|nr:GNAT family N-acetyltransferase [Thermoanaerobaculales bacterium]
MSDTVTTVRRELRSTDRGTIDRLLAATGFFNPEELEVAMELVDDRLIEGAESHYRFLVAERGSRVAGYACWGPIPGTAESADLYWIAVDPACQGLGVGRALLAEAERWLAEAGRPRVWIETAGRPQYEPTRAFYLACNYRIAAQLEDFYGPGDDKVIFLKVLGSAP